MTTSFIQVWFYDDADPESAIYDSEKNEEKKTNTHIHTLKGFYNIYGVFYFLFFLNVAVVDMTSLKM